MHAVGECAQTRLHMLSCVRKSACCGVWGRGGGGGGFHEVLCEQRGGVQVLQLVQKGKSLRQVLEFCEFMGQEAEGFGLKLWRMLIAESELQQLKIKYGLA